MFSVTNVIIIWGRKQDRKKTQMPMLKIISGQVVWGFFLKVAKVKIVFHFVISQI